MKLQPGILIVAGSDCYLEEHNENIGKNLYDSESKVKIKK
jgi:hypothetical protein